MLRELKNIEYETFICAIYKGYFDDTAHTLFFKKDGKSHWRQRELEQRFITNETDYIFIEMQMPYDFEAPF